MSATPYILISIVMIVIVSVLLFLVGKNKQENRLTPLAGLAFGFIVAGIMFGENRFLGYTLMGIGVITAVADIIARSRAH